MVTYICNVRLAFALSGEELALLAVCSPVLYILLSLLEDPRSPGCPVVVQV